MLLAGKSLLVLVFGFWKDCFLGDGVFCNWMDCFFEDANAADGMDVSESLPLLLMVVSASELDSLLLVLSLFPFTSFLLAFFLTSVRTCTSVLRFLFLGVYGLRTAPSLELLVERCFLSVFFPSFIRALRCTSMSLLECHKLKQLSMCCFDPSLISLVLGILHSNTLHKLQPYCVCRW